MKIARIIMEKTLKIVKVIIITTIIAIALPPQYLNKTLKTIYQTMLPILKITRNPLLHKIIKVLLNSNIWFNSRMLKWLQILILSTLKDFILLHNISNQQPNHLNQPITILMRAPVWLTSKRNNYNINKILRREMNYSVNRDFP